MSKTIKNILFILLGIALGFCVHYLPWIVFSYLVALAFIVLCTIGILGIVHIYKNLHFFPRLANMVVLIFLSAFFTSLLLFKIYGANKDPNELKVSHSEIPFNFQLNNTTNYLITINEGNISNQHIINLYSEINKLQDRGILRSRCIASIHIQI